MAIEVSSYEEFLVDRHGTNHAIKIFLKLSFGAPAKTYLWGIYPRIPSWLYMGRTIRGDLAHKIKACIIRLQGVLDIVIVLNRILYL
jgi:hypothetical protein